MTLIQIVLIATDRYSRYWEVTSEVITDSHVPILFSSRIYGTFCNSIFLPVAMETCWISFIFQLHPGRYGIGRIKRQKGVVALLNSLYFYTEKVCDTFL